MPKSKSKNSKQHTQKKVLPPKRNVFYLIANKIIGVILLLLALTVLLIPSFLPKRVSKNPITISPELLNSASSQNIPVRVIIPKSDIDLKVIPAKIVDGYWETSETYASYGEGSGTPGQHSNTVIFAHARAGLFYNLKDIKNGDSIYVFTKNKWYSYKVNKIAAVYPNQKEAIEPTKKETLTLYTCTGYNDEKRLIVTAAPHL